MVQAVAVACIQKTRYRQVCVSAQAEEERIQRTPTLHHQGLDSHLHPSPRSGRRSRGKEKAKGARTWKKLRRKAPGTRSTSRCKITFRRLGISQSIQQFLPWLLHLPLHTIPRQKPVLRSCQRSPLVTSSCYIEKGVTQRSSSHPLRSSAVTSTE
jgi:hypothetical protein